MYFVIYTHTHLHTTQFYIKDTKSSNGTFVNESRLSPSGEESGSVELKSRDILQFGVNVNVERRGVVLMHVPLSLSPPFPSLNRSSLLSLTSPLLSPSLTTLLPLSLHTLTHFPSSLPSLLPSHHLPPPYPTLHHSHSRMYHSHYQTLCQ